MRLAVGKVHVLCAMHSDSIHVYIYMCVYLFLHMLQSVKAVSDVCRKALTYIPEAYEPVHTWQLFSDLTNKQNLLHW